MPELAPDLPDRIRRGEFRLPLYADLTRMPAHERRAIFGKEKIRARIRSMVGDKTFADLKMPVTAVAAALVSGATEFCTLDTRQAKLATAAGLHVQP